MTPPLPAELTDTGPVHNNAYISGTYCPESVHNVQKIPDKTKQAENSYDCGIQGHVFSDRLESKRVRASSGWLRFNEAAVPAASCERKPAKQD